MHISDNTGDKQCAATEYGGFSLVASAARELSQSTRAVQLFSQPAQVLSSSNAAAGKQPVFCYATATRAVKVEKFFGLLCRAAPH